MSAANQLASLVQGICGESALSMDASFLLLDVPARISTRRAQPGGHAVYVSQPEAVAAIVKEGAKA